MDSSQQNVMEFPSARQFTNDELKLLLVAVRQMRRTFAAARAANAGPEALDSYEDLYNQLYEKLRRLAGPIPETIEESL